jgi:hypothetical protein
MRNLKSHFAWRNVENHQPTEYHLEVLASRFPSLKDARGISPWNPNQLDIWASEFGRDQNAFHAAKYLLALWNAHNGWECGPFDPKAAIQVWDRVHRRTFLESVACEHSTSRAS